MNVKINKTFACLMCFEIYKTIINKGFEMCKRFHFYLFFCQNIFDLLFNARV